MNDYEEAPHAYKKIEIHRDVKAPDRTLTAHDNKVLEDYSNKKKSKHQT